MENLNLPPYDYKLRKVDEKIYIYDILRRKYIVLTPEEWVRQHFVHFLINHHQYPKSLIKLESSLKYNTLLKRTDIQVYGRDGNLMMIVECKAPYIKLTQNVFSQAAEYNQVLKAEYLTITNGMIYHCCKTNWENKHLEFLKDLPLFV
ncbi:type I restriction enzyme HsdR N-terminal domain-containing protein [Arcicella rosea]|uniref:Type I restriction enzyme R protein N-terminal domain-containing protein n=1 Tax=Arcicella rosea TaxID=502909 RepID=A0A841EG85_9BACT|nr:type I restriction enzyme HsdR N-terminal domain-containing protein [Arcicella rosea]MBB6002352.1 hypothetical protein [Arcicella rosea]